jgi:hypothetical protein
LTELVWTGREDGRQGEPVGKIERTAKSREKVAMDWVGRWKTRGGRTAQDKGERKRQRGRTGLVAVNEIQPRARQAGRQVARRNHGREIFPGSEEIKKRIQLAD